MGEKQSARNLQAKRTTVEKGSVTVRGVDEKRSEETGVVRYAWKLCNHINESSIRQFTGMLCRAPDRVSSLANVQVHKSRIIDSAPSSG